MASRVMMWRSKYRRRKSPSGWWYRAWACSSRAISREGFVAVVEEVAQRVEDLASVMPRLGDLQDRFALPVQRDHVADGHRNPSITGSPPQTLRVERCEGDPS
jgi:hypothetical protein